MLSEDSKVSNIKKAKILASLMIESQSASCPLTWMFCSKTDMQRVEKVDNKLKIRQRHLQFLAIKMYKFKNKLISSFTWKTYEKKNIPYSLRKGISLFIPNANAQKYGINSLNFRGSALWNNLPITLKERKHLQEFKLLLM